MNLLIYGAQNLNNTNKVVTSSTPGARDFSAGVQSIESARGFGVAPVNKKIREKRIALSGAFKTHDPSILTLEDVLTEYKRALNDSDRYLHIVKDWRDVFDLGSTSGWSASADAENITQNLSNFQYGADSLSFDLDVSNNAGHNGYIEKSDFTQVDLSDVSNTGNFEFWVYLPDSYDVSTISVRIGNSSTVYYSWEVTTQFDGVALKSGWNFITLPWAFATETGTVNDATIDYMRFRLDYAASQADMNGILIDGLIWQNDDQTRNYRCYVERVALDSFAFNISFTNFDIDFLAYKGYSEATNVETVLSVSNITTSGSTQLVDFGGSSEQLPSFTVDITTADTVDELLIQNQTTGKSVTVLPSASTFADGDSIAVNLEEISAKLNGVDIVYNYVLPRFNAGPNRFRIGLTSSSAITTLVSQTASDDATGGNSASPYIAQSFTTVGAGDLSALRLLGSVIPSDWSGSFWIASNNAGQPGASLVSGGVAFKSGTSTVTLSEGGLSLSGATLYWIVLKAFLDMPGYTPDRYFYWNRDSANPYAGGTARKASAYNGTTWTDTGALTGDFAFEVDMFDPTAVDPDYNILVQNRRLYL